MERVDIEAEHQVEEEDEGLGAYHALPEIPRTLHFGHELAEEHRTTVGIHRLHQSYHLTFECHSRGRTSGSNDRASLNLVACFCRLPVRVTVGNNTHRYEYNEQVHPDRKIGNPAEFLECTDLSKQSASDGEDDATDHEAEAARGDLRQTLCVLYDNDTDIAEQLDRLEEIDNDAGPSAINTKGNVTVGFQRVPIRV